MVGEPFWICNKHVYIVWCNDRRWEQNMHQELKGETRTGTDTMSSSLHLMTSAGGNCGCCRWSRYKLRHDSRHNCCGHKLCQLWAECIGHRFCETWWQRPSISVFTHCIICRWGFLRLEKKDDVQTFSHSSDWLGTFVIVSSWFHSWSRFPNIFQTWPCCAWKHIHLVREAW